MRSVPSSGAVKASSGISERSSTTESSAVSRSKRQSSGFGRISTGKAHCCSAIPEYYFLKRRKLEAATRRCIEDVRMLGFGRQGDPVAGVHGAAPVGLQREGGVADLYDQLGLGAHRLDDQHLP